MQSLLGEKEKNNCFAFPSSKSPRTETQQRTNRNRRLYKPTKYIQPFDRSNAFFLKTSVTLILLFLYIFHCLPQRSWSWIVDLLVSVRDMPIASCKSCGAAIPKFQLRSIRHDDALEIHSGLLVAFAARTVAVERRPRVWKFALVRDDKRELRASRYYLYDSFGLPNK